MSKNCLEKIFERMENHLVHAKGMKKARQANMYL